MRIINLLEKNNIATEETLKLFLAIPFFFYLFWVFVEPKHLSNFPISYIAKPLWIIISASANLLSIKPASLFIWLALSLFFMALAGVSNLAVIYANNLCMPVSAKDQDDFSLTKKANPKRRLSILNKQTKLSWLCDRIAIGKDFHSVGDLIVDLGVAMFIFPFLVAIVLKFIK
jgi:hypothetical protein